VPKSASMTPVGILYTQNVIQQVQKSLWTTAIKSTLKYYYKIDIEEENSSSMFWEGELLLLMCFGIVYDFVRYFHGFNRFGFDIHSNFDWHIVIE
jgi:hypothetical protein